MPCGRLPIWASDSSQHRRFSRHCYLFRLSRCAASMDRNGLDTPAGVENGRRALRAKKGAASVSPRLSRLTFNQGVRGSIPRWVTKKRIRHSPYPFFDDPSKSNANHPQISLRMVMGSHTPPGVKMKRTCGAGRTRPRSSRLIHRKSMSSPGNNVVITIRASPYEARLRRTEEKRGTPRFMFALSVNFAFGLNGFRPCLGH